MNRVEPRAHFRVEAMVDRRINPPEVYWVDTLQGRLDGALASRERMKREARESTEIRMSFADQIVVLETENKGLKARLAALMAGNRDGLQ